MFDQQLLQKYNVPAPRYTSYPTVPHWTEPFSSEEWLRKLSAAINTDVTSKGISLYIHLPFCETLCTYCGCNKKITRNHSVESEYIKAVLKEWQLYRQAFSRTPLIRELHLGGGTPTFFSPGNLEILLRGIFEEAHIHPEHEFSIEGHPNNTSREHLEVLHANGFRRISYGVQDTNADVQRIINRFQPFTNVKAATINARTVGFNSVNFDLIYGLPLQTVSTIAETITEVLTLRPDRIAFYSYAHVPWTSRGQRLFDESHLPNAQEKLNLYQTGKQLLLENGYSDLGMDHFSLPTDALFEASENGRLHRNFMGYTTQNTNTLIGLGVSAISDCGTAFAQNKKSLHEYYAAIQAGELSIFKGYALSPEDLTFRKYIRDISCNGKTKFSSMFYEQLRELTFPELVKLQHDGLIIFNEAEVIVTLKGKNFIRNICRAFDLHLLRSETEKQIFSKAI